MNLSSAAFFVFALFLGAFGTARAATPTFPLSTLVPGQTGYALTATASNQIGRFAVEVLALQYDAGSGFPLVLVRASGQLIEDAGGVASGMSGSPVYLTRSGQDALLGAISFTFPGSTGGLGLVTPIATMRRADPRPDTGRTGKASAFGPTIDFSRAVPGRTPLLISGLSERASTFLGPLLAHSLEPLTLPTAGAHGTGDAYARQDEAFTLQPGSAISVQLVRGDVTVAAVGTLTLLEDGAFWAFGHPLLGGGPVSLALAPAYVTALVPSRNTPFKLADSGRRVLGSVTQDRPYAISGVVGQAPAFVPVTLNFSSDAGALSKRFEVAGDERLYAPLFAAATLQAFDELLEARTGGTAELAWDVTLKGGRRVRVLEQTTSPGDLAFAAAGLAAEPLAIFSENPFQAADVARVAMSIRYEQTERVADVVKVVPERKRLKAGETLFLNVRLQPFRAEPLVERVRVRLPPKLRGAVTLTVRGGATPPTGDGDPRPPLSFAELLGALESNVQASELVVEATVTGETRLLTRLSLPYLVSGDELVELQVQGPKPVKRPPKPEGTPDTSPDEPPDALPGAEPREDPLEKTPPLEPSVDLGFTSLERP